MLILIKMLCFLIWFLIMFYLISGSNPSLPDYKPVKFKLKDEENAEMAIRQALSNLKKKDRLIIEDRSATSSRRQNRFIFNCLSRKNPSIIYYYVSENAGY